VSVSLPSCVCVCLSVCVVCVRVVVSVCVCVCVDRVWLVSVAVCVWCVLCVYQPEILLRPPFYSRVQPDGLTLNPASWGLRVNPMG